MSKYHSQKATYNGITFDSKRERDRYIDLLLLERAGEISELRLQVSFELIPKQAGERSCKYIADFAYTRNGDGNMEVGIATCANHVGHMLELTSRVRGKRLGFWRMSECGTEKRCAILFLTRCGKESRRLEKNGKTCMHGLLYRWAFRSMNATSDISTLPNCCKPIKFCRA